MHSIRKTCRLCFSDAVTRVLDLLPIPVSEHYTKEKPHNDATRFPIDIYQCTKCTAVQTLDDIDPSFLWKDYTYYSGQTEAIVQHFSDVVDDVELLVDGLAGRSVFDIGSNDGTLLDLFRRRGSRVWGVDPAETVVQVARNRGVKTYCSLFDDACVEGFDSDDRFADVITAFNVFAHSANMDGMCRGVAKMLKPDGVFVFEVQYLGDIVNRKILGTFFHEHMIHYSCTAADNFLRLHGLRIFDYRRNEIQMGSIVFFATPEINKERHPSSGWLDLLKQEVVLGLNSTSWAKGFANYITTNREQALNFSRYVTTKGERVAAFGGARSGPSLLIQFGIDTLVDVLFDDHKDKMGRYNPFRQMPVLPTTKLSASDYKYCVVTAYIHIKPILRSLSNYIDSGGEVIALWPRFTVINLKNREMFLDELSGWLGVN